MSHQFWYGFLVGVVVMCVIMFVRDVIRLRQDYATEKMLSDARKFMKAKNERHQTDMDRG